MEEIFGCDYFLSISGLWLVHMCFCICWCIMAGVWILVHQFVCVNVSNVLLVNPGRLDCQGYVPLCLGTLHTAQTVLTRKSQGDNTYSVSVYVWLHVICKCVWLHVWIITKRLTILGEKSQTQSKMHFTTPCQLSCSEKSRRQRN